MPLAPPESTTRGTRYARPPAAAHAWLRLGDLLVDRGDISRAQLSAALERKRETGRRVGEELVASGHLRAERLSAALRLQRRLALLAFAAALIPMNRDAGPGQTPTAVSVTVAEADAARIDRGAIPPRN